MGALLDRVTLETWGDVIDATVTRAKDADAQARAFLAAYLVGKPTHDAPEPLAVTAARISGDDALVDKLADKAARRQYFGGSNFDETRDDAAQSIAAELPAHIEPQP